MKKSNLDLLNCCDQIPPEPKKLYKFLIDGYEIPFGHLTENIVQKIACDGDDWEVEHDDTSRTVKLLGKTKSLSERNEAVHRTLMAEREKGTVKNLQGWTGEVFPVWGPGKEELVLSIERAGAPLFGIVTYGVQMLAFQDNPDDPDGISIWIARRAKTKRSFPGMLDSTVGGSLPTGEQPFECLIRECHEEASFSDDLVRQRAVAVGTVSYVHISDERGGGGGEIGLLCPEVQFTYEMQLPPDIIPVPGDDKEEVESFTFMSVEQLKRALADGEFTPANGCIVLDFFIRHGILTYENEPNYVEIASRLHRRHDFQTS